MPQLSFQNIPQSNHVKFALACGIALNAQGLLNSLIIWISGLSSLDIYSNSYHVLFVRNEPPVFLLLLVLFWFANHYLLRDWFPNNKLSFFKEGKIFNIPWLGIIIIATVFFTWMGNLLILHDFPLSNDEFLPRFQAKIFLSGNVKSHLPFEFREFGEAITPIYAIFDPKEGTWISAYLPVYAFLRTLFLGIGAESLINPFLAGMSLLIISSIAHRVWPQEPAAPFIAVALLATSTQFLITSMTSYSYPAHLCFNLAWIYFFTRGDRLGNILTPWIGFFALGLHNPFIHALFVTPFLLSLLWKRKWGHFIYFGLVYGGGCLLWYLWWSRMVVLKSPNMHVFQLPGFYQLVIQPMNLTMLFSWQSIPLTGLALLSFRLLKSLGPLFRLLASGCLLTFGFFLFFPFDQVLGWGYRFFYGVLGNLVILALAGWFILKENLGPKKAWGFLILGSVLAILVQLPIRCLQVESFVRPFARSAQYIQSLPYSFITIDPTKVWFAQLLVRNDPFLRNHPRILFAPYLNGDQMVRLKTLGTVHAIQPEELARFGLHPIKLRHGSP